MEPARLPLSSNQIALLRRTVERHIPDLLPLVGSLGESHLNEADREALRSAVSSEFISAGLDSNDEPTPYGLELEALIDVLGHC
jgi:hypothetical protein